MSGKISGLVWDLDLPVAEKFVALALADHADHEGYGVRPSYDLIAWKTQYSRRYVIDVVALLEKKGIVILDAQGGPDPRGNKANEWHFDLDALAKYARPARKKASEIKPGSEPQFTRGSEPQFTTVVNPSSPQTSSQTSSKSLSVGGDKRPSTRKGSGAYTSGKYYPVNREQKIIYLKAYPKSQLAEFEEAWSKAGIVPVLGSALNSDPQYAEFTRKQIPAKRHLLFDAFAECAWHFPPGFNSEALNKGKQKLGGAIGAMAGQFAELIGVTFNETRDDELLARRVRSAFAKYDQIKKKPNGEPLTRPKNALDFYDWWNIWTSTYEGKVVVDRNSPAYGLDIKR